jgi:DNA polymerase-3 subunit beta
MDFTTTRDDLAAALSRVTGIVEKRSTTPILCSVLIQARHMGGLWFTATDRALTYMGEHPATVNAPGEVAVNAHELAAVVGSLRPGEIRVTVEGDLHRVTIKAGKTTTRLNGYAAADYPATPPLDAARSMTVAAADLRKIIDQTIQCVAPEDNRYGLNGAYVENVEGLVRFVATDGNRLAWSQAPFEGTFGAPRKSLVPRKGLAEMRKLLDGHDGPVEIAFGERAAVVRVGSATLHLRLLEADFPDYRQVIPTTFKRRVVVDRRELAEALKRVGIFATDGAHTMQFAFGADGGLTLSARKLDAGDAREEIGCDLTGEPITMGFNARFVQDALAVLAGPKVVMQLGDILSPCIVTDPDDARVLLVVMPIRLN